MKDEFSKNSLIIFVLNTIASGINYLCQIIMGRTMSLQAFGTINAIFSFILVVSVPGTTFNMLAAKYIAEEPISNQQSSTLISLMIRYAMTISTILLLLFIISYQLISKVLGSDNVLVILVAVLIICIGYLYSILSGALSGKKKFVAIGLISLVIPMFKVTGVIGTAFFKNDGTQVILVLCLMLVGHITATFVGQYFIRKNGLTTTIKKRTDDIDFSLSRIVIATFVCNLVYIFFCNLDVLSMNTLFGSTESGLYSSAMLFGRIIFYFVTALVTVMLPFVSSAQAKNSSAQWFLKRTLVYTIILALLCTIPFILAPKFFMGLIYGEKYLQAVKYIPYAFVIAVLISILNIAVNYLVGIGHLKALLITLCSGLVLVFGIMYLWHDNAEQVLLCIEVVLAMLVSINIRNCFHINR